MTRGIRKMTIYEDQLDRHAFLGVLADAVDRHGWRCHAYCLMTNHYHALVQTPEPNISEGMCRLNGVYARRFNARHLFEGHLFERRFRSEFIARESHLLEVVRYIELNPVRAGICPAPDDWPWSSYRAHAGLERPRSFLTTEWTLGLFAPRVEVARDAYRTFVRAGAAG